MMRFIAFVFLFITSVATAQVTDNFSDGDFTANPAWSGNAVDFTVVSGQLRSNSSVASSSFYLSTPSTTATSAQWELYVNLQFNTSSANYTDIYLVSDSSNLGAATHSGYFVRIGNTADDVSLYKRMATVNSILIDGANGVTNHANNILKIKVTRDVANLWTLQRDTTGTGNNYVTEGTVTDAAITTSAYFGIFIQQSTASFFNKHFYDSIYAGPIILDVTPPTIVSSTVISSTQVDVLFDESVDVTTAQTLSNYSANNGLSNPSAAVRDAVNFSLVHLTFATPFTNGLLNTLTVTNVQDLSANAIATATNNFTYIVVVGSLYKDVIINEIMADPTPQVNVPAVEFIEIYNRSGNSFNLNGWKFTDGSSTATLGNTILLANQYLIICNIADTALFTSYGNYMGVSSFPSINNAGDHLYLKNDTLAVIDSVAFTDDWYQDNVKKNGGWTLELINPNANINCPAWGNWIASNDINGGTPGIQNSVYSTAPDTVHPTITGISVEDSTHIYVCFSEALDASVISTLSNYSINGGIGTPTADTVNSTLTCVYLTLNSNLATSTTYILTSSNMSDCSGNLLLTASANFFVPEPAMPNDVVINEVLSDPNTGGVDYVEIYNRSNKVIDLKKITLSQFDTITNIISSVKQITTASRLILPQEYVLLSANGNAVKSQYTTTNPSGFIDLPSMISMNIDEGTVCLASDSNIIDKFIYYSNMHFGLLNITKGVSLERIDFNRPTQDRTNWHSAAQDIGFGTPGYKNSQYNDAGETDNAIEITPEIFSPDEDGNNDVVNINYHFDTPGFTANISIFDSKGRLTKHLIRNELLGINGTFSWDGINDDREKCRIGIYIIYFEVFDLTGTVKHYKKTCVLGAKL